MKKKWDVERDYMELRAAFNDLQRRLLDVELRVFPPGQKVRSVSPRITARGDLDSRGKSPVAHLLAGASRRAVATGSPLKHSENCLRLAPGVALFAYSLGLAGAVAIDDEKRWNHRLSFVIAERAELLQNGSL